MQCYVMQVQLTVKHEPIGYDDNLELIKMLAGVLAADWQVAERDKEAALRESRFRKEMWEDVFYAHKTMDRAIVFYRLSEYELQVVSCPLAGSPHDLALSAWNYTRRALQDKRPKLINPILLRESGPATIASGVYGRMASLRDLAKWSAIVAGLVGVLLVVFGESNVWDQIAIFTSGAISLIALVIVAWSRCIRWDIDSWI